MRYLRLFAVNAAVLFGVLVVLEGIAGYAFLLHGYRSAPLIAERRHTQYDPLLGWINIPSIYVPDMYGPGVSLRINRQGFRNAREFPRAVPPGRVRVVCSGDSFTLGYGVAGDQTWCERLTQLDARLETVNMGQGGYGVDQAYLWYKRDGGRIDHQAQLFAFIIDDFARARSTTTSGHGKPLLTVDGEALAVTNVPVPGPTSPALRRLIELARGLHTMRLADAIPLDGAEAGVDATLEMVGYLLADLQRINRERSSRLILVRLPTEDDLREPDAVWSPAVEQRARALGIPYIDLLDDFQRLTPSEAATLFIPAGQMIYEGHEGHYTVAGNELVAQLLDAKLRETWP
jgi:hypothetical protein